MTVSIQAISFTADQALIELAQRKVQKLNTFHDKIVDVEVFLKLDEKSSNIKDKKVKVRCNIPGASLFAEETTKLFEEGVDLAVDSIRRQLKKHKAKLRA